MGKLIVFNSISLDGYIADAHNDMHWAYNPVQDEEWNNYVNGNASGGGILLFGRVTFELMKSYWPTPDAKKNNPVVADRMNAARKVVFSRSLKTAGWDNTRIISTNIAEEVRKMKAPSDAGLAILGSGSIVAQFTEERLIDEYQIVVTPVVLGSGKTMFEGISKMLALKHLSTRSFRNGNVVVTYESAK
ncbi:MAG TPA: dihydrofolate reductase family protein [Bacteroidota bacterium]|nr:dihydrofolate reductase family protein [Bacteroidota bacterium]